MASRLYRLQGCPERNSSVDTVKQRSHRSSASFVTTHAVRVSVWVVCVCVCVVCACVWCVYASVWCVFVVWCVCECVVCMCVCVRCVYVCVCFCTMLPVLSVTGNTTHTHPTSAFQGDAPLCLKPTPKGCMT